MADQKKLVAEITSMDEDFTQWYTDVVIKAGLIAYSNIKGFMVYKPAGYALWEAVQKHLDARFKATGVENVALPLMYQGVGRKRRNALAMKYLDRLGLKDHATHLPSELSGGQKQRVAIARAMITHPRIILADEPTGALDSHTSLEVMQLLRRLNEEGMTIVVVTHESGVANMTNKIVHLKDGVIESVEDNVHHDASLYGRGGLMK